MSKHEHKDKPAKSSVSQKPPVTSKSYYGKNHSQDEDRHHHVKHQISEK